MCRLQMQKQRGLWPALSPLKLYRTFRRPAGARGLVQVPFNVFVMPEGAFFNLLERRGPENHLKLLRS